MYKTSYIFNPCQHTVKSIKVSITLKAFKSTLEVDEIVEIQYYIGGGSTKNRTNWHVLYETKNHCFKRTPGNGKFDEILEFSSRPMEFIRDRSD